MIVNENSSHVNTIAEKYNKAPVQSNADRGCFRSVCDDVQALDAELRAHFWQLFFQSRRVGRDAGPAADRHRLMRKDVEVEEAGLSDTPKQDTFCYKGPVLSPNIFT